MSDSEVMTILILYHSSSFRDLKHFYLFVRIHMKKDFPHTVSYNRFVELERKVYVPFAVFLKMRALEQCTAGQPHQNVIIFKIWKRSTIYAPQIIKYNGKNGKTLIDRDVRKRGAKHSVHFGWISVGFEEMELGAYNGRVGLRPPKGPKTRGKAHEYCG